MKYKQRYEVYRNKKWHEHDPGTFIKKINKWNCFGMYNSYIIKAGRHNIVVAINVEKTYLIVDVDIPRDVLVHKRE